MPEKPFIAARIPEELNQALIKHVESSGLNRTEVIIDALATYLKFPTSFTQTNKNDTRLNLLEERISILERLVAAQNLPSSHALDTGESPLSEPDCEELNRKELEIKSKSEEWQALEGTTIDLFTLSDNSSDNTDNADDRIHESNLNRKRLTHTEVSQITGINYNTVKSRAFKERSPEIEHGGKIYAVVREGKRVHWVVKTVDNVDDDDTLEF